MEMELIPGKIKTLMKEFMLKEKNMVKEYI
jgi:hypothetical protein